MNPLYKAWAGMLVRMFLLVLGAHGVELTPDDKDTLLRSAEMAINGLLIAVPLIWSAWQKYRAHDQIQTAQAEASRRG